MRLWFQRKYPDFIHSYREQTCKRMSGDTPLQSLRLVALDCETSGMRIGTDRILSIATIEIIQGQIEIGSSQQWIVFQQGISTNKATEIHGILPVETQGGTPEEEVLKTVLPLLSGAIIVGHNIWFDAQMLNEALRLNFKTRLCNRTLDVGTMAMSELAPFKKTGYANQRNPSLEDISAHLGLPMHDRHTAAGDAYMAAEIFLLLCGRMRKRLGRPLCLKNLPVKRV
jgi:DNA polymerase-3 subunit epsilon